MNTNPFFPSLFPATAQPVYPTIGQIVRTDPRLDTLIPGDAKIEVVASGFVWVEGPVWVKPQGDMPGFLLVSDVPENTVFRWTEKDGLTPFLNPSGYTGLGRYSDESGSNGLAIDGQGRLISSEHGDRRISAMPLSGTGGKVTLADNYRGKRLNSPNDVAAHPDGSYFFTDPPYGLPDREKGVGPHDLTGVYRIAPDGIVSLFVGDLTRPNGVAISPDGQTVYVTQSDRVNPVVMAYPLQPDGSAGKGDVVFGAEGLKKAGLLGAFDGMKVDQDGNLWVTGGRGVLVLSAGGELLGHVKTGVSTSNCAWGDDGSTLYITADMFICRVKTTAKGF